MPTVHMHTAAMSEMWPCNVLRVSITALNLLTTTQESFGETSAADCCESKSLVRAYVGSDVISVAEMSCG